MPIWTNPRPRELLTATYATDNTTTNTTGNGEAFTSGFGGSFVSQGGLLTIETRLGWGGGTTGWWGYCLILDGSTNLGSGVFYVAGSMLDKIIVTGVSAGAHTIAVNKRVESGTGTYLLASVAPASLQVFES